MDTQQILGVKHRFTHGDRVYQVSYLTQEIKALFESWLKENARQVLIDMRGKISAGEWRELFLGLTREMASGDYAFHGSVCLQALRSPIGIIKLASLLFGCSEEEISGIAASRADDLAAIMELIYTESMPRQNPGGADRGNAPATNPPSTMPAIPRSA